ncbi:signal peptidase I [Candidatus Saccharibacteria bacterium]|nr:signal peptidase I [Candidatus Saccharibacteria bacterium]
MNPNNDITPPQTPTSPGLPQGQSSYPSQQPTVQDQNEDKVFSSANTAMPSYSESRRDGWRSITSTLLLFLLAPVIALAIAAFVVQSYQVDGESMETTLQHQDRLIVNKLSRTWARITNNDYIPRRGEIIIFNQPSSNDSNFAQDRQLIKRVIALPGERIVIRDGKITIYNEQSPAGFNPDDSSSYKLSERYTSENVDQTIPDGEVFVCGDNRQNSEDSRWFGPVPSELIVGKLVLRILPFDKLKTY